MILLIVSKKLLPVLDSKTVVEGAKSVKKEVLIFVISVYVFYY